MPAAGEQTEPRDAGEGLGKKTIKEHTPVRLEECLAELRRARTQLQVFPNHQKQST